MKKRLTIISAIIAILVLVVMGYSTSKNKSSIATGPANKQLTEKEKLDDFEYMYTILKDNFPYFEVNKRLNGVDWLSNKDKYIEAIKASKSDDEFFKTLDKILCDLNNGHTSLLRKNWYLVLKNLYVRDEVKNAAWLKELNKPAAIKRYSAMEGSKEETLGPSSNAIPDNVKTAILEKNSTAYMAIHTFNSFNINDDMKIIRPFLESVKDYNTLIIDIRGNGGGDSSYWSDNIVPMLLNKPVTDTQYIVFRGGSFVEEFLKSRYSLSYSKLSKVSDLNTTSLRKLPSEIKQEFKYYSKNEMPYNPKNSIGFKGKIYLLIDGGVFSSSEAFAVFATLVGEQTGGDGIGFDPAICTLPNSGYVFNFPLEMGLTSDGECNFEYKTQPDIKASAKVGYTFLVDDAIQAALKDAD